jgi:hypothetical protein
VRSTKEVIAWVEQQFGLDYTESGMLKLLKRLGYHFFRNVEDLHAYIEHEVLATPMPIS